MTTKVMNNRKMIIKMKAIKKKSMQYNLTTKMIKMEMKMKMKMKMRIRMRMRMRMMKNSFDDCHILKINIYASELKVKF